MSICWLFIILICSQGISSRIEIDEDRADLSKKFHLHLTQHRETRIEFPDLCPPAKDNFTAEDCEQPICNSTTGCSGSTEGCCFNGCQLTCLPLTPLPTSFDWLDDLRKIPIIFDDSNDEPEVECSTSGGKVIQHCPTGHICQILDRGDPLRGIPNRGVCVNLQHFGEDVFIPYMEEILSQNDRSADNKEAVYLPGGCFLTTEQYGDIEEFLKGLHFTSCVCSAGSVICSVPQIKDRKLSTDIN